MVRRRSVRFLLSDFLSTGYEAPLARLARRHDVIAIQVMDPRERALPDVGLVTLWDPESDRWRLVDTRDAGMRERFRSRAAAFDVELERTLAEWEPICSVWGPDSCRRAVAGILPPAGEPPVAMSPPSAARIRLALALASPFGATLGATSAAAQLSEGRSFSIVAEPAKVGLGDSVTVRFRLSLNERDLLTDTVPRPVDELPEGVRILSVGKLSRGADRVFTGTAVLAFYRPGKRVVPVFGVPWVQVVTGHRGVVAHEAGEVEVAAILPAGNPPLRDIREPNAPRSLGVLWGLLGAGLVAVLAWLATRRRVAQVVEPSLPKQRSRNRPRLPTPTPPPSPDSPRSRPSAGRRRVTWRATTRPWPTRCGTT